MKTQDRDVVGMQSAPPPQHFRSRASRRLGGIGAGIAVALVIGLSAVVFAQLGSHRGSLGKPAPIPNTWEQVLKGYTVTSVVAAPNDSSVLYACAATRQEYRPLPQPNTGNTIYTVLRSIDLGKHWQDVASKERFGANCELAINPTNSNELYAIGATSATGTHVDVLKHSMNGGQTWQTIVPTIRLQPEVKPVTFWHVIHLRFEGGRLFAIQWLQQPFLPQERPGVMPAFSLTSQLVTSSDGGHTWIEVKSPAPNIRWGVRDFAVDPSNANTIYEAVGGFWLPIAPAPGVRSGQVVTPPFGLNMQLYKTTDGGATWKLLLKDLPFGTQIALARNKPQVVYAGSMLGPLPLPETAQPNSENSAIRVGTFQLRVSSDGGANWHEVAFPPQVFGLQSWFVSVDGQVYVAPIQYSGQPTAVVGTIVPATRVVPPSGTKGTTNKLVPPTNGTTTGGSSSEITPATTVVVPTTTIPVGSSQSIWRYDPATGQWSQVTKTPTPGALVGVTPNGAGTVLWFIGLSNQILYRYGV